MGSSQISDLAANRADEGAPPCQNKLKWLHNSFYGRKEGGLFISRNFQTCRPRTKMGHSCTSESTEIININTVVSRSSDDKCDQHRRVKLPNPQLTAAEITESEIKKNM